MAWNVITNLSLNFTHPFRTFLFFGTDLRTAIRKNMYTHTTPASLLLQAGVGVSSYSSSPSDPVPLLLPSTASSPGEAPEILPPDVIKLILDTECNGTVEVFWGSLQPRQQRSPSDGKSVGDCIGGINCTVTAQQPPRGASVMFPLLLFLTGIIGEWGLMAHAKYYFIILQWAKTNSSFWSELLQTCRK